MQATLQQDKTLDIKNVSVAYVGVDQPFTMVEGEALSQYLARLAPTRRETESTTVIGVAPMETE